MKKKIIYIPMETKRREYHAKLLFALYAVCSGYQVVIGSKNTVNKCMKSLPQGIYIGTGVTIILGKMLLKFKELGHSVVAFDEEGLIYYNQDNFMRARVKEDIIQKINYLFTWGDHHSKLVQKKAPELLNYSAIGNMRFELLKQKYSGIFDKEAQIIKEKYGNYILLNTNLGIANHLIGTDFFCLSSKSFLDDSDEESFYTDMQVHDSNTFESFRVLVTSLADKLKTTNIIIRPHPSENKKNWEKLFNKPNVNVVNSGNVIPWIMASSVVIQKNCTTAVEAVYLNRPVITYSVKDDPRYDSEITNGIGKVCHTEEEVFRTLDNIGEVEARLVLDRLFLKNYISNMDPDDSVSKAALDILDKIDSPSIDDDIALFRSRSLIKRFLIQIKETISPVVHAGSQGMRYLRQKFPGLSNNELKRDVKLLSQTINISNDSIRVKKIRNDMFHLTSSD